MIDSHPIITVYHGTTSLISNIDVLKGKPYKDFGQGFYVTQDYKHVRNLAVRNKFMERERYGQMQEAYVYTYNFDMNKANNYNIQEFTIANIDWMRFVLANRRVRGKIHNYDIVIGPTANDDTSLVLKSYFSGVYGDIDSERALQIALEMIESENLPVQIYFGSNAATECLLQKGIARKV